MVYYTCKKKKGEISMKMYRVLSGKYVGRVGRCEFSKYGSVMFYPIEGIYPYRVCLMANEVEEI
jgi:hypothetical protein